MDFIDIFKHAYNILGPYSHIPVTLSYPKSAFCNGIKVEVGFSTSKHVIFQSLNSIPCTLRLIYQHSK